MTNYFIAKWSILGVCWLLWYILFGIECFINGIIYRNPYTMPFKGLWQDIVWIVKPIEGGPGILHYILIHGLLLVAPVVLVIVT